MRDGAGTGTNLAARACRAHKQTSTDIIRDGACSGAKLARACEHKHVGSHSAPSAHQAVGQERRNPSWHSITPSISRICQRRRRPRRTRRHQRRRPPRRLWKIRSEISQLDSASEQSGSPPRPHLIARIGVVANVDKVPHLPRPPPHTPAPRPPPPAAFRRPRALGPSRFLAPDPHASRNPCPMSMTHNPRYRCAPV